LVLIFENKKSRYQKKELINLRRVIVHICESEQWMGSIKWKAFSYRNSANCTCFRAGTLAHGQKTRDGRRKRAIGRRRCENKEKCNERDERKSCK